MLILKIKAWHASSNRVKPKFKAFLYWSVLYKFTVKCDRHKVWAVFGSCPLVSNKISTAPVKKRYSEKVRTKSAVIKRLRGPSGVLLPENCNSESIHLLTTH
jgi:hypothetical protein